MCLALVNDFINKELQKKQSPRSVLHIGADSSAGVCF